MPYAKNADLPASVKKALPAGAQSIYRGAYNSAHEGGASTSSASKLAWGAVKARGYRKGKDGRWRKRAR